MHGPSWREIKGHVCNPKAVENHTAVQAGNSSSSKSVGVSGDAENQEVLLFRGREKRGLQQFIVRDMKKDADLSRTIICGRNKLTRQTLELAICIRAPDLQAVNVIETTTMQQQQKDIK